MDNKKKNNNLIIIVGVVVLVILILLALWFFVLKGNDKKNDDNTEITDNPITGDIEEDENYDYTKGVLHKVKDSQYFVIKGLFIVGDERDDPEYMDKLSETGFSKSNIKTSFKKNEWINIYLDTEYASEEGNAKVFILPHRDYEDYKEMDISMLQSEALETGGFFFSIYEVDSRNYNFAGNGYVSDDAKDGDFDILFTYDSDIIYYAVIEVK